MALLVAFLLGAILAVAAMVVWTETVSDTKRDGEDANRDNRGPNPKSRRRGSDLDFSSPLLREVEQGARSTTRVKSVLHKLDEMSKHRTDYRREVGAALRQMETREAPPPSNRSGHTFRPLRSHGRKASG